MCWNGSMVQQIEPNIIVYTRNTRNRPKCLSKSIQILPYGTTAHVEPCPPLYSGFLITQNYTHGRTPLDE
jgi:hypothetical protein